MVVLPIECRRLAQGDAHPRRWGRGTRRESARLRFLTEELADLCHEGSHAMTVRLDRAIGQLRGRWPNRSRGGTIGIVEAYEVIDAIEAELMRLCARGRDASPVDAITVQGRGDASGALRGSVRREGFAWVAPATEILQRLRGLPDRSGPELIRSAFRT